MTTRLTITGTATDPALRNSYTDPILTEGSLILIDPTHPANPWSAGIPSTVPNLAAVPAAAAVGSAVATLAQSGTPGTLVVMQRSGKGGLHGVVRQVTGSTGSIWGLTQSTILTYLNAHTDHAFYLSIAGRLTRDVAIGSPTIASRMAGAISGATHRAVLRPTDTAIEALTSASRTLNASAARALGNFHVAGAWSALGGSSASLTLPRWSSDEVSGGSVKSPSFIMYRVVLEDLTVSGRAPLDVWTLDQAITENILATRYTDDTYTSPATLD